MEVDVFFCVTHYDERVLQDALEDIDAPIRVVVRMREIARDDEYNTGFTYSNQEERKSVVVIGKATSPAEFMNTTMHEMRHLTDDIATANNLSLHGEDVGYLQGKISGRLSDTIGRFVCPCCNNHIFNKRTKVFTKHAYIS